MRKPTDFPWTHSERIVRRLVERGLYPFAHFGVHAIEQASVMVVECLQASVLELPRLPYERRNEGCSRRASLD